MNIRLTTLAVIAFAGALSACASPNYTMGPDSARYVGSTYRHRDMVASSHAMESGAAIESSSDTGYGTGYEPPMGSTSDPSALTFHAPPPVGVSATLVTQDVSVTTNKGARTARSVAIPPRDADDGFLAPAAPPAPPAQVPAASVQVTTPSAAPIAATVNVAAPVVAAAPTRATRSVNPATEPAPAPTPPAARRFLRLKITGMESPDTDPMEVRRQLRTVDGVKEVVLSFKTKTAIIVVDKDVSADAIISALEAPYGAETLN